MADHLEHHDPVYRTGAGYPVMIAWTVLIVVAYLTLLGALSGSKDHRNILYAVGAAVMVFGPLSLAVYLLRRRRVFVVVDPDRGLLLRGTELIPWEEIRRVEAVKGLMGLGTQRDPVQLPSGRVHTPETWLSAVGARLNAHRNPVAILLYTAFMPVLSVFTPWHPKVILTLKGRSRLVLHELERDLVFCFVCLPKIRGRVRS